jgi:hypothetical protein
LDFDRPAGCSVGAEKRSEMKPPDWLAAAVLFLELPVPLYWLILHVPVRFWRRHLRTAYWVAGFSAWAVGGVFLYALRDWLFAG